MPDSSTVLVLGGGVGGVTAATSLRRMLSEQHRLVIVDRQRDHLFAPSLLWLMTGKRTSRKISRPLDRLTRKGIEVIHGDVFRIDPDTLKPVDALRGPTLVALAVRFGSTRLIDNIVIDAG